ncbi:hypothetical protein EJF36_12415 [Bacillus sp. HMF5848]|uniref:hypothetical protein n=1 Tax=Bacillus sp. HMF5848 TaxID=2495421 RepID=UPI000F78AE4D|nr:hypothetical protein [Bacillus sp. HMF5848]RSK27614.1 hypothetical protein EJF36_12415 [Bacillus sp. HMF5848]
MSEYLTCKHRLKNGEVVVFTSDKETVENIMANTFSNQHEFFQFAREHDLEMIVCSIIKPNPAGESH